MQKLMLGAAGLVLVLLIVGFALPRESRFVVATEVDAPAATVFVLVDTPRRVRLWSGLAEDDPEPVYNGPPSGTGAAMSWDTPASGAGTLEVEDSRPWTHVGWTLNADGPGEASSWFELEPRPGATVVRWGFSHDYGLNVIGRYVGLLATGILRRDFSQRLQQLKDLAESLPRADFSRLDFEPVELRGQPQAQVTITPSPNAGAVESALRDAYFDIAQFIERHGLEAAGPPRLVLREFEGASRRYEAAIPLAGTRDAPRSEGRVRIGTSADGPALKTIHAGTYARLAETHRKIMAYIAAAGLERAGAAFESYVNDPANVAEAALITEVYYPVAAR